MENKKKEILKFFEGLDFDKIVHEYSIRNNKIDLSVSDIIENFVEPFDTYNISKKIATKKGISQREILENWDKIKDEACKKGNETHLFAELYPFNKQLKPKNKLEEAVVKFWKELPSVIVPVTTELQMFHKIFMFAGTADILLYNTHNKNYILGDFKTNKNIFKNYQGKKMLKPFDELLDCSYNKYQLQLSFYQILFEQTGRNISSRKLIWLKPDGDYELYTTENYTKRLKKYLKNNEL